MADQPFAHKIVIPGNHDVCFEEAPSLSRKLLDPVCTFLLDESTENQFADDCIERSDGLIEKTRAEYLYEVWTTYDRSPPVAMDSDSGEAIFSRPAGLSTSGMQTNFGSSTLVMRNWPAARRTSSLSLRLAVAARRSFAMRSSVRNGVR